jgi:hypothetical protein
VHNPMKTGITVVLTALLCGVVYLWIGYRPVWQFDHLEGTVKRAISGTELQAWATNLLAQNLPGGAYPVSTLGTNFPPQLRGIAPRLRPYVMVRDSTDPDLPSYVEVLWGSGFLGSCGFQIGPTNFVGWQVTNEWQPGIYFRRD